MPHRPESLYPSLFPYVCTTKNDGLVATERWVSLSAPLDLLESPPRVSMTTDS